MAEAIILPSRPDDETLERVIEDARKFHLVPCQRVIPDFRLAFFRRDHIPHNWTEITCEEAAA